MGVSAQERIYKMCVTESQATSNDCYILKQAGSKINCVNVKDSTDCALKLQRGEADFGIFTADEAILLSKFDQNEERKVIAEIRELDRRNAKFKYETVAIVKGNFTGPLSNLKGKNFCHPGFSKSQIWSERVLKHFERVVLNRSVICDTSLRSSVESELHALSTFFTSSCRPGDWLPSDYSVLDKRFKQREYSNLCSLCDSPRGCSYNHQSDGNQYAALDCLTKHGGDVTYVSNYYARLYFGQEVIQGIINRENVDVNNYNYLCPNGNTQPLSNSEPCTWIAQPWDSIIARDDGTASGLSTELQKNIGTEQLRSSQLQWVETFEKIVGKDNKVFMTKRLFKVKEYIETGREIPVAGTTLPCQQPIKWCTVSNKENEKCEWLKEAGIVQGIVPELTCVQGSSETDCFNKIRNSVADIMGIDSNLGTIANHYYNLSTVLYQEIEVQNNSRVVAVVKKDVRAGSIKDLKDKAACFPEFGGLAWAAFAQEIDGSQYDYCPYDNTLGDFFTKVCAPGATSRLDSNTTTDSKYCQLCRDAFSGSESGGTPYTSDQTCNITNRNKFYGDSGALQCLASGVAEVAVISTYNLTSHLESGILPADFATKYSILCKNGSMVSLTTPIDDKCAITTVTGGELVSRKNSTRFERRDLGITLETYADSFGYFSRHYLNSFHMFDPFDGEKGLLFKSEALQFVTIHDRNEDPYVAMKTYTELIENAEKCGQRKSGAEAIEIHMTAVLFMVTATVLQVILMF